MLTSRPATLRRMFIVLALGLVVLVGLAAVLASGYRQGSPFAADRACADVPKLPELSPQRTPELEFPYGSVQGCRFLFTRGALFADAEASGHLLLETEQGLVAIRVDYRDIDVSWKYSSVAVEVSPDAVEAHLGAEELRRLHDDVGRRGGVRKQPWTLVRGGV